MSTPPLPARSILRDGATGTSVTSVTLDYAARFLRRKRLTTDQGWDFLVDLPQATSLEDGDTFVLEDDREIRVVAAEEHLIEVTGADLPRLAWHIGNRHTPCQFDNDRLLVQSDPVMSGMLAKLGAATREVHAPFRPDRGAYGHGRTHGHDHGSTHGHGPTHSHG